MQCHLTCNHYSRYDVENVRIFKYYVKQKGYSNNILIEVISRIVAKFLFNILFNRCYTLLWNLIRITRWYLNGRWIIENSRVWPRNAITINVLRNWMRLLRQNIEKRAREREVTLFSTRLHRDAFSKSTRVALLCTCSFVPIKRNSSFSASLVKMNLIDSPLVIYSLLLRPQNQVSQAVLSAFFFFFFNFGVEELETLPIFLNPVEFERNPGQSLSIILNCSVFVATRRRTPIFKLYSIGMKTRYV